MAQGLIAAGAVYFVYMAGIISPGCSPHCDYALFNQVNHLFRWVVGSLFGATLVTILVLWSLGRRSRWAPAGGIALTIVGSVWATIAAAGAFTP